MNELYCKIKYLARKAGKLIKSIESILFKGMQKFTIFAANHKN